MKLRLCVTIAAVLSWSGSAFAETPIVLPFLPSERLTADAPKSAIPSSDAECIPGLCMELRDKAEFEQCISLAYRMREACESWLAEQISETSKDRAYLACEEGYKAVFGEDYCFPARTDAN